ncbi:GntP family permease [Vibrio fluvialis]|uniref:GntP family permease n=1 Tax=Vibrio fluvialis TaxID=676 RepID=UPI000AF1AE66
MEPLAHSPDPTYLLLIAACAIAALLILIMKLKVHAFASLTLVSFGTALATGMPSEKVVPTMMSGFGGTLASVALLVGLGAMIGKILEVTGGAKVLADTLIGRFGEQRAPLALGVASLMFGFPIFFDAGLIVMMPILFSVAKRFGGSPLKYALPAASCRCVCGDARVCAAAPGPCCRVGFARRRLRSAADCRPFGGDADLVFRCLPIFGLYSGNKFNIPLSKAFLNTEVMFKDKTDLPKFSTVLLILILPVLLIFMDTGLNTLAVAGLIDGQQPAIEFLRMLGKTPIALLITLLVCLCVFAGKYGMGKLEKLCTDALAPICAVILVTGAGGMFGGVLRSSGIGQALADVLADTGMPVIVAAFVISTCLRVAQGSATVALTTTAALMAPIVSQTVGLSELDLCFIVIAIAGGATVLSHFNDSGFWLVSRLLEMDEKTTLKTWTVMETLLGTIAFVIVALLSFIF